MDVESTYFFEVTREYQKAISQQVVTLSDKCEAARPVRVQNEGKGLADAGK